MAGEAKVVVVDDDEAARESLQALLESHGLAVHVYASPRALLEDDAARDAACIVSDVRMPGMDGVELLQALRSRGVATPIILITGHGDVPLAVRAMRAGARDFIEKPFEEETIVSAIRDAVAENRQESAEAAAASDAIGRVERLTPRERAVLEQLVVGHPNKVIAYELGISPRTVEIHRARVMEKMQARNLSHAVRLALAAGIDVGQP
jgi:two-component system response regulator FixJ